MQLNPIQTGREGKGIAEGGREGWMGELKVPEAISALITFR